MNVKPAFFRSSDNVEGGYCESPDAPVVVPAVQKSTHAGGLLFSGLFRCHTDSLANPDAVCRKSRKTPCLPRIKTVCHETFCQTVSICCAPWMTLSGKSVASPTEPSQGKIFVDSVLLAHFVPCTVGGPV